MTTSVLAAGTLSPSVGLFARHGWQVSWLAVSGTRSMCHQGLLTFPEQITRNEADDS